MRKLKTNKRGQVGSGQVAIAIALGIGLLVIGGLTVATQEFRDTLNATTQPVEFGVLNNTLNMYDNLATQLPTVGTILGVAILIGVIVGSFLVGRFLTQRFR